MKETIIVILRFYKKSVSPVLIGLMGHACRYQPTCGNYFASAIEKHGVIKGSFLGIKRILRCHPFYDRKLYFDPVPNN
jgi:uncharacterized protein